jgi:hypothetical protein
MDHSVVGTLAAAPAHVGGDSPSNLAWVCVTVHRNPKSKRQTLPALLLKEVRLAVA